jgi:hypothetical protein
MKALLPLVASASVTLALSACSLEPGGPQYAEIGLRTVNSTGAEVRRDCVPLPVLPGGRLEEDFDLAPGLDAHVTTLDDSAEVTLTGTDDPAAAHVTVPKASLLTGYSKILAVTTTSGTAYSVVLLSPCVPPDGGT